jgi:23S rRNA (uracil1939-C5)-methyltransferase
MSEVELDIASMGSRGEGIALHEGGRTYVPLALPGERVSVRGDGERAQLLDILHRSADRISPFCPYFGSCGGCAIQHWAAGPYADWKRSLVVQALEAAGLEADVAPMLDAHGAGRRRVTLHARTDGALTVGFMAARSHSIVDIAMCPILEPALASAPDVARQLATVLRDRRKPMDIQVTAVETGLDVDVRGYGAVTPAMRLRLTEVANTLDLARLSIHGDIVVERRPPTVMMGRARVLLPPGSFLQATSVGEATLANLVQGAMTGAKKIVDLFAGSGPFTLRLADTVAVHAVDSDAGAINALTRAANALTGRKPVTSEVRDLFRRPLLPAEVKRFDAVVFDPPRAGAEAQVRVLAVSGVQRIVGVSCHPGSFARDARILIDAGFRLTGVTPVDQFRHSPHVELVGVFDR